MKKKKLKKKIKQLEYRVNYISKNLCTTIDALNLSESHVAQCKDAITKLENDNKYFKEWAVSIPCYECTNTDKKMCKSKEDMTNGN